jgi:alpha-glucosidase
MAIAKGMATMLLASRASALTYYGAEIGMRTRTPTRKEDVRDPIGVRGWPIEKGRDGERTPMQWTSGPGAGFTTSPTPWLPLDPDPKAVNVAAERADPASLLNWYRTLAHLRLSTPALRDGTTSFIAENDPEVLAWLRTAPDGARVAVAINMSSKARDLAVPGVAGKALAQSGGSASGRTVKLAPFGVWIGALR